ncbi:MAG TPA: alpha-mannosidase, partial [Rhodanobacteraceae bacterium]|nr:alpha-mannosidase [Rhodanobacteraceae bacterium]
MVTRRRFLQGAMTLALLERIDPRAAFAKTHQAGSTGAGLPSAGASVSQFVDVFVGTGGHGHTFPGATVPWGMVQLSPDTHTHGWDACSGYHEGDGSIIGFSHTHLSGTGGADMLDVLVMPAQGEVLLDPGARGLPDELYYSRYDAAARGKHLAADVVAHPGKGYRSRYDKASERGT